MAGLDYDPYGRAPKGSSKSLAFNPYPTGWGRAPSSSGLTAAQYIKMIEAKKKEPSHSFFDEVKHAGSEALHPVGWTFDKLLRPEYAIANAVDKGIHDGGFDVGRAVHGAREGFMGREKEGFGEVLKHHGVLEGHGRLRGLAGFGLDIVADPLTYVSGGAANVVLHSAEHAAAYKAGELALRGTDDVAHLEKASHVLTHAGDKYKFRSALAKERLAQATKKADVAEGQQVGRISILSEAANAERKANEKFLPQFKIGTKKHSVPITPTTIAGKRVVPALPKLDNAIAKGVPLTGFRNKFIRSAHESPEAHAALITHRHLAEDFAGINLHILRDHFRDVKLSEDKALEALHHGEITKNFVIKTKKGKYRLNEGLLSKLQREGKLDAAQVHFLRRWHQATELLYRRDKSLGVNYEHLGDKGQLYVPHLVDKSGHPLADVQANKLTEAGFQKARTTKNYSVAQLAQMAKNGELGRGVETDPFQLLAHTARSRASKQADAVLLSSFARNLGTKTRLVDSNRLAKNQADQLQNVAEIGTHQAAHDEHLSAAHTKEQLFLAEHEMNHTEELDDLMKQIRSHKFRRNTPTKAATLAKMNKRLNRLHAQHLTDLEEINTGKHGPLNEHIAPHLEAASQHNEAIKQLEAQQKSLLQVEKRIKVGKKNREYSVKSHKTVSGAVDEHGHPLAFEPETAHAIEKYQKIVAGDDNAVQAFGEGWRKWLANWKLAVTSVNPGYRVRNTMSDVWAMYVSGMPMHQVVNYGKKAQSLMTSAKAGDPEALRVITEAYHHGILSGLYQGDVQAIAKMIQYSGSKRALIRKGKPVKLVTKIMQDMNANVENWGRLTHYLYRKDGLGESTIQAAQQVKKAHFDYEDLTPFEQKVMKGVAPFYTWTRKNVPFQIKALISHPGQYAAFPKLMQESEFAAGGDQGNLVPDYIPQALGFQIPFGKHNYYLPQIGAADLQLFDSKGGATSRLAGLANPALKLPFELMTNKSMFTGAPIAPDNHTRAPVSGLGADLLSLIPGSNVGETARTVGGKRITGKGANPYYQYLLGQIPLGRELGINASGIQRGKTPIPPEVSYVGGQSVQHVDPEQQAMIASMQLDAATKLKIAGLRDQGDYPLTKKKKKSKNQQAIDRVIRLSEGRR